MKLTTAIRILATSDLFWSRPTEEEREALFIAECAINRWYDEKGDVDGTEEINKK